MSEIYGQAADRETAWEVTMRIRKLRTNHIENPLGYILDTISLSWIVDEAKGKKSVGARVEVSTEQSFEEKVYDSGIRDDINPLDFQLPLSIKEGIRYFWRVQVWDDRGDTAVSKTAFFEAPVKIERAKWIQAPFSKEIHPLFCKKVIIRNGLKRARLYISGLGVYEVYINREKVGDEYLTPSYNNYNFWVQYQTYEVTENLHEGINILGAMLGNGWYKGHFGLSWGLKELYGDKMMLIAELHLDYEDGSKDIICTDESWMCAPSPVLDSSIYDGEVYDSRKECPAFIPAVTAENFDRKLSPRLSAPLKIMDKIIPTELLTTNAGEKVLDFGQIISGWVEFTCREPRGTEVFFQFGELLQNGNFYNENLRTAKQEYRYIADGTERLVRPHFTFYGFRYMKIMGITDIRLCDFTGCVIYTEMDRTGYIKTSNEKVNRLFANALWGQLSNFLDVPTDCPQRDERLGWTGDAQIFSETANLNMYTPAFYRKYMRDMRLEQDTLEGSVPWVVPDVFREIVRIAQPEAANPYVKHGSCAWGDAAAIIPWNLYCSYGDKTMLAEQYSSMKDWVDYIRRQDIDKCGGSYLWTSGEHFADWLALDNFHRESRYGATDPYYVASVYYYCSALFTAKAAGVLEKNEDYKYYQELAEKIKQAVQKEYFTATGRPAVDTQTGLVLALYFDLVPESFRHRAVEMLMNKLREEHMHLTTGFVGTGYICAALAKSGQAAAAYTLLLNEDYPSWLYEVNMGATTVWERWNSILPDGKISSTGMNSMNHYAYGAIAGWMYRYMCGVNICEEAPGYRRFVVRPYVDQRFEYVSMEYESASGYIKSQWRKKGEGYVFQISVPFDTEAVFYFTESAGYVSVNGTTAGAKNAGDKLYLSPGEWEIYQCSSSFKA